MRFIRHKLRGSFPWSFGAASGEIVVLAGYGNAYGNNYGAN